MMANTFSSLLFYSLDCIGFSKDTIISRSDTCCKMFEIINKSVSEESHMDLILAGSKSEGVAPINASDLDVMFVPKHFVCVDTGSIENDFIVFEARAKECPPGYAQIRIMNDGSTVIPDVLHMASEYDILKGVLLLKSTGFQQAFALVFKILSEQDGIKRKWSTAKGPSCPVCAQRAEYFGITSSKIYIDHVIAITYYSSIILTEWKERTRQYEWPPSSLIEDVSTMEGYVVPVGHKLSEEQNFEWRICFTTAERKLITSLSETQLKLYVLFKMVNEYVIKPGIDCVTSYMVKNIVVWITECSPQNVQCPSYLTLMLMQCLSFLLYCLYNNHLPNYMIPSRNLLLGKIEHAEKQKLIHYISVLLNEGECIVLRCPKLRNAMHFVFSQRSLASTFRIWRDEVETLILAINLKLLSKITPEMACRSTLLYDMQFELLKDGSYFVYLFRLFSLLNIDVSTLLLNGMQNFQDFVTGIEFFLS